MIFSKYFLNDDSFELNWDYIMTIPEFKQLEKCQQSQKWHGEGNALIHTRNVVTQMNSIVTNVQDKKYYKMSTGDKKIMIMSALFHDIGKISTTFFKKDDWHSYNHEIEGEKIARKILWDENTKAREEVCALVRWHMHRYSLEKRKNNRLDEIVRLSFNSPIDKLIALFFSDAQGSMCSDQNSKNNDINNIIYIECISDSFNLSKNYGMEFASPIKKYAYNKGLLMKNNPTAYVLIGISGAGKDTYIENHPTLFSNAVELSRDKIRIELGYCKENEKIIGTSQQEDNVTDKFNELLNNAVKENKNIIFNNMNIKKKYRDQYHELLDKHNYNFVYIYIESPSFKDNVERRKGQISEETLGGMIYKIEWPLFDEYDQLLIEKQ